MIEAGINDGDIVVIPNKPLPKRRYRCGAGRRSEATLKRFRRKGNMIALEAANPGL